MNFWDAVLWIILTPLVLLGILFVGMIVIHPDQVRTLIRELGIGGKELITWAKQKLPKIKKLFASAARFCYTELTGKPLPDEILDLTLTFTSVELKALRNRLEAVYLLPILEGALVDEQGIYRIVFKAAGLQPAYRNITREDLCKITRHISEGFYMEFRGRLPSIYLLAVTPELVHIATPLSERSRRVLEDKLAKEVPPQTVPSIPAPLEEEIPLFPDEGENEGSVR